MEDPSPIAAKKTRLSWCTAALGLFVSLSTPILWPSFVIAQSSSQVATPVNFFLLTGSTPNIPSALRWHTLPAQGTSPRKQAAELPMNRAGTVVAVPLQEGPTPRIGADMQLAPAHSSWMAHGLPELVMEDTPFSTQVRMTVANLLSGRLQFDAFYREISADSVFRGPPQSSSVGWATPGSLTLRSATSYGIRLSFRMPRIRTRTLYRCLLGRSG